MGAGVTETGDCSAAKAGHGVPIYDGSGGPAIHTGLGWDESPRQSVGLQVTQDRVLIKADREDKAPQQTASGIYVAQSLAAAVDGSDSGDSWFHGTIVQLGPKVNRFEVKPVVWDWLQDIIDEGYSFVATAEIKALQAKLEALPDEHLDGLKVGQRVVFSWAAGQQITIDEDRYVVLRAEEVLAVLEAE